MNSDEVIQQKAFEYIKENKLLSLATSIDNKPWAVTVFYSVDENFRFYFFSDPQTTHCQHIAINPHIAATIHQGVKKLYHVRGVQLIGKAQLVDKSKYAESYSVFKEKYPWADKYPDHVLYEIVPTALYYLDSELLGHHFAVKII